MITFYTGTPGSGKSFSMAFKTRQVLLRGQNVISTVAIDLNRITKNGKLPIGKFDFVPIEELTPDYLYSYFAKNHVKGKEKQTYLFIDECQIIFNTRDWQAKARMAWILFFTRHRHLGFEITLITQNDMLIDKQIRAVVETEVKHKKANNLLWFLPFTFFVRTGKWYSQPAKKPDWTEIIFYRPSVARIYDSYAMYDEYFEKYSEAPAADARDREQTELTDPDVVAACEERAGSDGGRKEGRPGYFLKFKRIFAMQ